LGAAARAQEDQSRSLHLCRLRRRLPCIGVSRFLRSLIGGFAPLSRPGTARLGKGLEGAVDRRLNFVRGAAMSAGEVERLVSELSGGTGGDEEEEWLYGGTELPVSVSLRVLSGFPSRPPNGRRPGPLAPRPGPPVGSGPGRLRPSARARPPARGLASPRPRPPPAPTARRGPAGRGPGGGLLAPALLWSLRCVPCVSCPCP
jgi:hypothetical protein